MNNLKVTRSKLEKIFDKIFHREECELVIECRNEDYADKVGKVVLYHFPEIFQYKIRRKKDGYKS